jgi:hypothetical protein
MGNAQGKQLQQANEKQGTLTVFPDNGQKKLQTTGYVTIRTTLPRRPSPLHLTMLLLMLTPLYSYTNRTRDFVHLYLYPFTIFLGCSVFEYLDSINFWLASVFAIG